MRRRAGMVLAAAIVAAAALGLRAEPELAWRGRAMGTTWNVKAEQVADVALVRGDVERAIVERLEELERQFSTYRASSEVSRFNVSPSTEWVAVSRELAEVAEASVRLAALSEGAFDPTIAPLLRVWGLGPHRGSPDAAPGDDELAAARVRMGWSRLEARREPAALRKNDRSLEVDFSSMAKGYAADVVGTLLRARGLPVFLVQIGGDVACGATRHGGEPWLVGVEHPERNAASPIARVRLVEAAISTSGQLRNAVTRDGRRFGHIIDARTGRPAENALLSVSVLHREGAWASGWATALIALGEDDGWRVAREQRLAALFLIQTSGGVAVRATPEFQGRTTEPAAGGSGP